MPRGKRFFLYCQHLAGTGHFVRTYEIARSLAVRHDVYLLDGGRPIPRLPATRRLMLLPLPRIYRVDQNIVPLEADHALEGVMRQRRTELLRAIERIRPEVVMVEHFPFSKWELGEEILSVVQHARNVNPNAHVVCSLRDIVPATRYRMSEQELQHNALQALHEYFDLVLVHADPDFVRLENYLPWADQIATPIEYTGYVSQRPRSTGSGIDDSALPDSVKHNVTIVSAGGDGPTGLVKHTLAAWELLRSQSAVSGRTLAVFLPLSPRPEELALLDGYADDANARLLPFTPDFVDWMAHAELSISQAGYNTCTNLLQTRTRAILVPNPHMPDQVRRAHLFAERGLAVTIDPAELTPERMAAAIVSQLRASTPEHHIRLDGAQATRKILEQLAAGETCVTTTIRR